MFSERGMFRRHGNLAIVHFPLFCFTRRGPVCVLFSVSTRFFLCAFGQFFSIIYMNHLVTYFLSVTFALLSYFHDGTFLLFVFICFNSPHLKLVGCFYSPPPAPPSIHPSIHVLASLVWGPFFIVVLMHADPSTTGLFWALFPSLCTLSALVLFWRSTAVVCREPLRGWVGWFSSPCQRCFWSSFSC